MVVKRSKRRYTEKPPLPGTKPGSCGAPRKASREKGNADPNKGKPCRMPAGAGTEHLGQGRCRKHGGNARVSHGWYSMLTHHRISELLVRLSQQSGDVMDLVPEANLLRAMTIDFINQYDRFVEALLAWYADPENKVRPRRIMDIADASHLVESISRVVQRMHQIQTEGAISLDAFRRVTEQMGISVAKYVKDSAILNKIESEWMDLALDAKAPPTPPSTDTNT